MEYHHEQFTLNKLCQFRGRDIEADFMEYDRKTNLKTVRIFMLFLGGIFALFGFFDYYFYGLKEALPLTLALRGTGLLLTICSFFLAGRFKRYEHTLLMITITQLAVFFVYLINLYMIDSAQPELQYMSVIIFILLIFLVPNTWKNSFTAGCIILICYMVFRIRFLPLAGSSFLMLRGIYITICLVVCAFFLFSSAKSRRMQFAAEKLLEFMSITDSLTNIYNRSHFDVVLTTWIKNMRHNPFSLLFFDIDDFKKVNDRFGHAAGDRVLVGIAETVSAHIRVEDIFARYGGEEFVVLFEKTGLETAAKLAERLRLAIEQCPFAEAGKVTISIGVAEYTPEEPLAGFVKRADEKMYEAKRAGKNQVMA